MFSLFVSFLQRFFTIGTSNDRVFCNVASIHLFKSKRDFTDSGPLLSSLDRESKKVTLTGLSRQSERCETLLALLLVSASLRLIDPLDLPPTDISVVDLQNVKVLLLGIETVFVDANNDLSA